MEISQEALIACVIVIVAGAGLIYGKLSAKDFLTIVGMVLSFLAGKKIGYKLAIKKIKEEKK